MGFLSGSSSVVRFHAEVPHKLDRAALCDAINRRAFREHDEDGLPKAEAFGWVAIHDPLVVEIETADVFFQQYALIGFRYDRRIVPAKLLKLERRRAEEERKKTDSLERLGRTIRREIKEEVAARLMRRGLPSPSLFDCAWNLETGALYFTGKAKGPREAFAALFRDTCGVNPMPAIPYFAAERIGLSSTTVDAIRAVEPSSLTVSTAAEEEEHAAAAAAGAGASA